jgi:dTDP-4-amino-4,6-dideoxygalactose transaminase
VKVPFVDLRRAHDAMRSDLDRAVKAVMDDAAFIGTRSNVHVRAFEAAWADHLGVGHAVGCANGTDAIEMTLTAMGIGPGDEVIVPAMTWISTASAVARVGARPVFVDVDATSYTLDPALVEATITDRTKAFIAVHLYGLVADMGTLMVLAERYGLYVIEDAAQAHGAHRDGGGVGAWGHAATFSFFPSKNLGAFGDAGCVVTNDAALADEVRLLSNHGQLGKHDFSRLGRNSRLDGMQAAVLSAKLPYLSEWIEARRETARRYSTGLATSNSVALPNEPRGAYHVYHQYVVITQDRPVLTARLAAAEVGFGHHYPSKLWELPFLSGSTDLTFPVASRLADRGVSLPMFPGMTDEEVSRVIDVVNDSPVLDVSP